MGCKLWRKPWVRGITYGLGFIVGMPMIVVGCPVWCPLFSAYMVCCDPRNEEEEDSSRNQGDTNELFIKILMKDEARGYMDFPVKHVRIPRDVMRRDRMTIQRLKAEIKSQLLESKSVKALHVYERLGKHKNFRELRDDQFVPPTGDLGLSCDITLILKSAPKAYHTLQDLTPKQPRRTTPLRQKSNDGPASQNSILVSPNGTIGDIRLAVAQVRRVASPQDIALFYKGKELNQDKIGLKTFSLYDKCTILVRDSPWLIKIHTLRREVINVCVKPSDTTDAIRDAISRYINPTWNMKDYVFVGSDGQTGLVDQVGTGVKHTTLKALGVTNRCNLHMIPKLRSDTIKGCRIIKAEHRGIQLTQLRELASVIIQKCVPEGWTSTNPELNGKLLQPQEVTLYDLMELYIRPLTSHKKRSYVEHVSDREKDQIPMYFCSHWWGESVLDFVACLEQHTKDRGLPDSTPYWVCAYALNQHDVAGELDGSRPKDSPFFRAMHLTKGTVSVLDSNAVCYTRIWCAYEISLVMLELKKKAAAKSHGKDVYIYDVYTVLNDDEKDEAYPVGLMDRTVTLGGKQQHQVMERELPLDTLHKALTMQLERAEASMPQDKNAILNSIIGERALSSVPPKYHSSYDKLNASLRARLAESTYPIALEKHHPHLADFRLALAHAPYKELQVSFNNCQEFLGEAGLFWRRALPSGLSSLDLDLGSLPVESSEEFIVGLGLLTNLQKLRLNLSNCRNLKNVDHLWKEVGQLASLKDLELDLSGCQVSNMDKGCAWAFHQLGALSRLKLNFGGTGNRGVDFSGLKEARTITELYLDVSENSLASIDGAEDALSNYRDLRRLDLTFKGLLRIQSLQRLGEALITRKLVSLCLNFNGCGGLENLDGLGAAIRQNTQLVWISLDFQYCIQVVSIDELVRGFTFSQFPHLSRLALDFGYCSKLRITEPVLVSDDNMPALRSLKLGFADCHEFQPGPEFLGGFNSFEGREFDVIDVNLVGTKISTYSEMRIAEGFSKEHVIAAKYQLLLR